MQSNAIVTLSLAAICASLAPLSTSQAAPASGSVTYEIVADGMCCQGCAKKVAAQLYTAPGVINVKSDVAKRTVIVTAKPSPKLTPERLWGAVEKAKGQPSRLSTSEAVFILTRAEKLSPEERPGTGSYSIIFANTQQAELAASGLRTFRGVQTLDLDPAQRTIVLHAVEKVQLSPWALTAATGEAAPSVVGVNGPFGRFTIQPVARQAVRADQHTR